MRVCVLLSARMCVCVGGGGGLVVSDICQTDFSLQTTWLEHQMAE